MEADLPAGWELVETAQAEVLVRVFDRGDFVGAVDFINAILPIAEDAGHHPDLRVSWKQVEVTLITHSEGRVTEKDYALARAINALG